MSQKVASFGSRFVTKIAYLKKGEQAMVAVAAVIAVVGVVMTVGPVVGWIAGMAFVIAGIIELEDYVKLARRSVDRNKMEMSPKVAFFESRLVAIVTQLYKSDQVKIAALAIVITGIIELETVVITVVPVVGWIAGLTTVIAGLTGLENHVKSARRSVEKRQSSSVAYIESRFTTDVIKPFKSGVRSIGDMVDTLGNIGWHASGQEVKAIAPLIKSQAKGAYKNMRIADQQGLIVNRELDEIMQKTVNEQGRIRHELSTKAAEKASLNRKCESLRDDKRQIKNEMEDAQRSLDSAERSLSDAKQKLDEKKREQAIVAGVGVAVTLIPIVGWFAGPAMVIVSLTALEENVKSASQSIGYARDNVNDATKRLNSKESELSEIIAEINRVDSDYHNLENQLSRLERVRNNLIQQLKKQAKLSENVKECVTFISVSFGRTSVLKDTARNLYNLEPLIEPLRNLAEHFSAPEVLRQPLLRRAVKFGEVGNKLKMICNTESIELIDDEVDEWC